MSIPQTCLGDSSRNMNNRCISTYSTLCLRERRLKVQTNWLRALACPIIRLLQIRSELFYYLWLVMANNPGETKRYLFIVGLVLLGNVFNYFSTYDLTFASISYSHLLMCIGALYYTVFYVPWRVLFYQWGITCFSELLTTSANW